MDDIADRLPRDVLRKIYGMCVRTINDDNRARAVSALSDDFLDLFRKHVVGSTMSVDVSVPGVVDAYVDADVYGTGRRRIVSIAGGSGRVDTMSAIVFMKRSGDTWSARYEPCHAIIGGECETMRAYVDDAIRQAVDRMNARPSKIVDRRHVTASEILEFMDTTGDDIDAASRHFGISTYRLHKITTTDS